MAKEHDIMYRNLREFGRGIIGGLLFSLPIIYTMEVWWTGFISSPERLIAYIVVTFMLLLGYNKFAGMRENSSFSEICWDSVEEIGLAFIVTFLLLWLLGRIHLGMSVYEIIGKTIVESMIMAIGISVGTAQLGQKSNSNSGMSDDDDEDPGPKERDDYFQLSILSICGSVLVASSVAPTEEIMLMGIQSSIPQLLLMIVISICLGTITLYFSDFRGTLDDAVDMKVMAVHIFLSYMVAMGVSVGLLWFFGRLDQVSFQAGLSQTIVLSIPAIIGACAGRLLITNQIGKS